MIKLPKQPSVNFKPVEQLFILLYGPPKIGKTEFSHYASNQRGLYLATEAGQDFVPTYNVTINRWQDFLDVTTALKNEKDLPYKTIVIDTIDNLHKFCADAFNKHKNVEHESDLPMGKGYSMVNRTLFNGIQELLSVCRMKQWGCIFISHSRSQIDNPDKIKPGIPTTSYATISAACDMILYMASVFDKPSGKNVRVFRTKPTPLIDAGDRTGCLPELLTLGDNGDSSFKSFSAAYTKAIETKRGLNG